MADVAAWFSAGDLETRGGVRLFCLPHAGSGAAGFFRWKRLLPAAIEVCPVLLPGRERRLGEAPATDAVALVAELMEASAGLLGEPYAIFGHSMGALIGYEWARQIEAAGLPGPRWLMVSGRDAPSGVEPRRALHGLRDEEFVAALRDKYRGMPLDFMADAELRDVFLPILRADLMLVEGYGLGLKKDYAHDNRDEAAVIMGHPEDGGPEILACQIAASAGVDDSSVSDAGLMGWAGLTSGRTRLERYPGDHFYHLGAGQGALLTTIATLLTT